LVSKLTTLVNPELTLNGHFALCYITHMCFGANGKSMNEDRPTLSAANCSPGILVSSEMEFIRIFEWVHWTGGVN